MSTPARKPRGSTLSPAEIDALEHVRLRRRWSYRELAADISQQMDVPFPEPTLSRALSGAMLMPTTSYPLREYLKVHRKADPPKTASAAAEGERPQP